MSAFLIHFDHTPFDAVDELALLARQDYNLGGIGDWFGEFRGGLYGFYARLYGIERHYCEVHEWLPLARTPTDTECHLTTILFQMDSALECLAFAVNAFGWAVMPDGFRDVTDGNALRKVGPIDILGDSRSQPPRAPLEGYLRIFPTFTNAWQREASLIAQIQDLHDVSKHRQTIYRGGKLRADPPPGFYEKLGVGEGTLQAHLLHPMAEIILMHDPKVPAIQRTSQAPPEVGLLEDLVPLFRTFIGTCGDAVLADARSTVPLNEKVLRG